MNQINMAMGSTGGDEAGECGQGCSDNGQWNDNGQWLMWWSMMAD